MWLEAFSIIIELSHKILWEEFRIKTNHKSRLRIAAFQSYIERLWVKVSWVTKTGRNFDDYLVFQPKITQPKHFCPQCNKNNRSLPWKTLYLKKTNKNNKSLPWSFSSSSSDSSSMTSSLTSFSYSSFADFGFLEGVTSSFSVSGFFSTLSSCWSSSRSEEDLVLTIWLLFPLPFPLPLPTIKKTH